MERPIRQQIAVVLQRLPVRPAVKHPDCLRDLARDAGQLGRQRFVAEPQPTLLPSYVS